MKKLSIIITVLIVLFMGIYYIKNYNFSVSKKLPLDITLEEIWSEPSYNEKVKEFSPDAYKCLEETKKEFYKNSHQGVIPTIQILEDSVYYQNCIGR
jgi:hypothetical protein